MVETSRAERHIELLQLAAFEDVGFAVKALLQALDPFDAGGRPGVGGRIPTLQLAAFQGDVAETAEVQGVRRGGGDLGQAAAIVQHQSVAEVPTAFHR